ncbi:MAG TPA: T9SS type A sorting domain-containing protein [bacterium]
MKKYAVLCSIILCATVLWATVPDADVINPLQDVVQKTPVSNETYKPAGTRAPGDVIYELDVQLICNDNQLLGIEWDGECFYITGGATATDPNKVYVVDTLGTLIHTYDQPGYSTGWGWRDLAWDGVNGPGGGVMDTLYGSVDGNVAKFSLDGAALTYYGGFAGPQNPNRALGYDNDQEVFFTANFASDCYMFNKTSSNLMNVANTLNMYGCAYDSDSNWVWWHSQDPAGGTFADQLTQMDPATMAFTGLTYAPSNFTLITAGIAGGLCYGSNFRNSDVLFLLVQGTPDDIVAAVYLRDHGVPGVEEGQKQVAGEFGFVNAATMLSRGNRVISYQLPSASPVSLTVYDIAGSRVATLVESHQQTGLNTATWNTSNLTPGVYFLRLSANGKSESAKVIIGR